MALSSGALRGQKDKISIVFSHAAETVGEHHPSAAHRCNMAAVFHIAANVRQIHQQGCHSVADRLIDIANLCSDDRFHRR